jgi:replication factor C subunit 2/4
MSRVRTVRNNIESNSSKTMVQTGSKKSNSTRMSKNDVSPTKKKVMSKNSTAGKSKYITEYQKDMIRLRNALPWVEKYRPQTIDNVSLDRNIKRQIKRMIEDRDVRNIILEGPSGVGKTSTVRCIAREIFGKYYARKVLEINASDDRGIKIQNPIEIFNRAFVHIKEEDKEMIPDFKLVILDEADNMTDKAKHNITKFIETNKKGVRFAFTCNSKDNISTAIQSRCHILNYPKLEKSFVIKRLKEICYAENIYDDDTDPEEIDRIDEGIFAISEIADGDLRIAVNTLQLTYDRYKTIDAANVYGTYDKPHPEQARDIIWACIEQDLVKANRLMSDMIKRGFSVTDITAGLNLSLRQSICQHIPDVVKISLIGKISYSQYNVSQGLELSHIQARGCVADMCDVIRRMDREITESTLKIIKTEMKNIQTLKKLGAKTKSKPKAKSKAKSKAKAKPRAKTKPKARQNINSKVKATKRNVKGKTASKSKKAA